MDNTEKDYIQSIPAPSQLNIHDSEDVKLKMKNSKKLVADCLSLKYDNNGQYLAIGHKNGSKLLYSTSQLKSIAHHDDIRENTITSMRWRPTEGNNKNNVLVSADAGGFITYSHIPSLKPLCTIHQPQNSIHSIDFSPDVKFLVSGGKDANVRLYDESTKSLIRTYQRASWNNAGHDNRIFCVKFLNEHVVATGGWDSVVHFWDVRQQKSIRHFYGANISGQSLDFTKQLLLAGCYSAQNQLQLWDLKTLKKKHEIDWTNGNIDDAQYVYSASFAKNNKNIFGAGSTGPKSQIRLYKIFNQQTKHPQKVASINGLMEGCLSLDFAANKNQFAFSTPHHGFYIFSYDIK